MKTAFRHAMDAVEEHQRAEKERRPGSIAVQLTACPDCIENAINAALAEQHSEILKLRGIIAGLCAAAKSAEEEER